MLKTYGEEDDADHIEAGQAMPHLRRLAQQLSLNDIYNADEFAFYYSAAPTTTIGSGLLSGPKKAKDSATLLVCSNLDGTDNITPLLVGRAQQPRRFNGREGADLGFDYYYRGGGVDEYVDIYAMVMLL